MLQRVSQFLPSRHIHRETLRHDKCIPAKNGIAMCKDKNYMFKQGLLLNSVPKDSEVTVIMNMVPKVSWIFQTICGNGTGQLLFQQRTQSTNNNT